MDIGSTVYTAAIYGSALLLGYYIVTSVIESFRLREFKGPLLGSFSYFWILGTYISGKGSIHFADVHKKYGKTVKIAPNQLITCDPDLIRHINGARSTYRRSDWYDCGKLDPYFDNMITLKDTVAHDKIKTQTAPAYAGKDNPTLEADIDTQISGLIDLIRRKYLSTGQQLNPLDLATVLHFFTFEVIGKIAYSKSFGHLEQDKDVFGYFKTGEDLLLALQFQCEWPLFNRIVSSPLVLKLLGPTPEDKSGVGLLLGFSHRLVAERFGPNAKVGQDMLGSFIKHGLTERQCQTEVLLQIFAGTDTTATVLRMTMLHLITTPHVLQKLRNEIEEGVKTGKISSPIQNKEAKELPYLQAVIFEGLRINPPFTGLVSKKVPPGGDTIDGHYVPEGTRIGHSVTSALRTKAVFGDDVDLFRPERWIEADQATKFKMEQTTLLAFGFGRWSCAGKPVAFMELNKVYVELLRRFDFQLVYPKNPLSTKEHNMYVQKNLWVRVSERD